jgi:predicted nucleotidyltransferase
VLRTLKYLCCVVIVLSACVICSNAQTQGLTVAPSLPSAQDSEILKLLEKTKLELDFALEKHKLYEARLQAKDTTIQNLEGAVKQRDEQLALALSANKDRAQVNTGDARILSMCEANLAKADARIYKLEHPGFLRSIFDYRTLSGAVVGYGIGQIKK